MFEKHDAVEDLLETVLQLPVGVSQHSSSTVVSNPARLTAHAFRSRDGHTEAIQRQALIGSLKWCDSNSKLVKMPEEEAFVPKFPYCELVGALMYIATCTRPDIAHAVGEVAKFCERYGKSHWAAAKRILKYLKTTKDISNVF